MTGSDISSVMRPVAQARRVGLMGGSFDPVHQAHLALADQALAQLELDEVRWIPVGQPWQKTRKLAPAADRVAMLHLATRHAPRFVVDLIEVARPGPSYTLDTVTALQAACTDTEWFLILGQDQYGRLSTWHDWPALLARVTCAVASRNGETPRAEPSVKAVAHRVVALTMPEISVSSTEIRARLLRGADPTALAPEMVSEPVARYIALHQLYASGTPR